MLALTERAKMLMRLLIYLGYGCPELYVEDHSNDETCPGICRNPGCSRIYDGLNIRERGATCTHCNDNTVMSLWVLLGVV